MKIFIIFLALYGAAILSGQAAPLTFNTALPVSKGEFILRQQLVIDRADKGSTQSKSLSTLVYGLSAKLALLGTIPYVNISQASGSRRGIGDSVILARYTIHQNDFQGGTFRIAPFAGVKLPTGAGNLGTDSRDIITGLVATYGNYSWELDGQISYRFNENTNIFGAGDVARADISLQYRLLPARLTADSRAFVNGLLEAILIHSNRNRRGNILDPDSGGTTLFLVPGLQYVRERFIIEGGVQLPLLQRLNGAAEGRNFIARGGLRINF